MARSRRESLLSDGTTDQKCPQGLLQQNRVKSRHRETLGRCPLSPQKRTL